MDIKSDIPTLKNWCIFGLLLPETHNNDTQKDLFRNIKRVIVKIWKTNRAANTLKGKQVYNK